MKTTIRDVFAAIGQAFTGVDFEEANGFLEADEARLAFKHRVTIALPQAADDDVTRKYIVYSRVAADVCLLDMHQKHTTDFDAFEIAEAGEVLNLLVEDGYHRIHCAPISDRATRRWLGTRGMLLAVPDDPEAGILLFEGDVRSDVGLA